VVNFVNASVKNSRLFWNKSGKISYARLLYSLLLSHHILTVPISPLPDQLSQNEYEILHMRGWSVIDIWIYIVLTGFNTNTSLLPWDAQSQRVESE
jgi:hypothetical protein